MSLPDSNEKHIDFVANVSGWPIHFRIVAATNKKYGDHGVDLTLLYDEEEMLAAHGRRSITDNERQFAILASLYLALRDAQNIPDKEKQNRIFPEKDNDRWSIDE